jgi:hypothetical protein
MTTRRIPTYQLNRASLTSTNLHMDVRRYAGPWRELILWLLLAAFLLMLFADAAYATERRTPTRLPSRDPGVPNYNIEAICRGAGSLAHLLETAAPDNAQNCTEDERRARQQLVQQWTQFDLADRVMCNGAARSGTVEPAYTELMTCLEITHDNHGREATARVAQRPDQSQRLTAIGAAPDQSAEPGRNALAGR